MLLQDVDVEEITSRMDVMIKLMAALFAKEFRNIDAIVKLENMKLSREQIAEALGITTQNVRQQLYMASKKGEKKADKKSKGLAESSSVEVATGQDAEEPQQ